MTKSGPHIIKFCIGIIAALRKNNTANAVNTFFGIIANQQDLIYSNSYSLHVTLSMVIIELYYMNGLECLLNLTAVLSKFVYAILPQSKLLTVHLVYVINLISIITIFNGDTSFEASGYFYK